MLGKSSSDARGSRVGYSVALSAVFEELCSFNFVAGDWVIGREEAVGFAGDRLEWLCQLKGCCEGLLFVLLNATWGY
jgi:hypothetical protein